MKVADAIQGLSRSEEYLAFLVCTKRVQDMPYEEKPMQQQALMEELNIVYRRLHGKIVKMIGQAVNEAVGVTTGEKVFIDDNLALVGGDFRKSGLSDHAMRTSLQILAASDGAIRKHMPILWLVYEIKKKPS